MTGEIVLLAGMVQKTSFVADVKFTLDVLCDELLITVSLDKVSGVPSVTVPIPTSNKLLPVSTIQ
jgi:hypothetical protein